VVVVNG